MEHLCFCVKHDDEVYFKEMKFGPMEGNALRIDVKWRCERMMISEIQKS